MFRIFYNKKVPYTINYNEEKNQILKIIRGVGFDEVADALEQDSFLEDIKHFNPKKYPNQSMFVLKIKNYIYVVPYVKDKKKKEVFLKTLYPSRKFAKTL